MSELYSTSTSTETSEPADSTSTATNEGREPAPDRMASQHEDNAAIEARLDEADLPTRADSRDATWGPDAADDADESDLSPEAAAAIEARLGEADLPTRADSRDATWGPDAADDADQSQTAGEYDTDLTAAGKSTGQNAHAGTSESTAVIGEQTTETRSGTGPLTDTATTDETSQDQQALTVVQADPADRTLGDTTPVGIGLKPTGDQLLDMKSEKQSRLENFRDELYEDLDDITDSVEKYGDTVVNLVETPPAGSSHAEIPANHTETPHHAIEGGHLAVAGFLAGVLMFEAGRAIKHRIESWRRR